MKKQILGSAAFLTLAAASATMVISPDTQAAGSTCHVMNGALNYTSLNEAVNDASDGDILKVYPGVCDITKDDVTMVQGQAGWYLPIEKSITIMGVDNAGNEITDASNTKATLYSSTWVANGAWASQNLITVFADDVTISGLTIMDKPDGNKTIEVAELSDGSGIKNFTLKNSTLAPLAKEYITLEAATSAGYTSIDDYYEDYKEYGASMYLSGDVENAQILNNIFQNSGLTFDHPNDASTIVTGNTFSGVKHWSDDPNYVYASFNHTNWSYEGGPVGLKDNDLTNFGLVFNKNIFKDAGVVNFKKAEKGNLNFSYNYWGTATPNFDELIITAEDTDFTYKVSTYYTELNADGTIKESSIYPPLPTPEPTPTPEEESKAPAAPNSGFMTKETASLSSSFTLAAVFSAVIAAAFVGLKKLAKNE